MKIVDIKDIPWYEFTIVRHTKGKDHWSNIKFAKRLFADFPNKILYSLSSESDILTKIYESGIIEDIDPDCREFFIKKEDEIVGYAQKFLEGPDTQVFTLLVDAKWSDRAVDYINKWRVAVNKHGFFWDLSDCKTHRGKIYPIDLDSLLYTSQNNLVKVSTDKNDWPFWTQIRTGNDMYHLGKELPFQDVHELQECLAISGAYIGPKFSWNNPTGTISWTGMLRVDSLTWKEYKKIIEEEKKRKLSKMDKK